MEAQKAASRDIKAVAQRLRQTMNKEETVGLREGYDDGVKWAREYATLDELRDMLAWEPGGGAVFERPHSIVGFISTKSGDNVVDVRPPEGNPYWRGFIDGVTEVHKQVAPLL